MKKVFLTSKEIAELFGFSNHQQNIKQLIHDGTIPKPTKLSHKRLLWYIDDVEKWLVEKGFKNVNLSKFIND